MGKAQIDRQRHDVEAERRPRFQPVRQRRQRGAAATLAVTGILLHPRDDRLDLRQIDLVVAGGQRVIVRVERGLAVGAAHRTRDHHLVGLLRQQSSAALPPEAALARAFTFGPVGAIGFIALRGRHRGVVRRLRRSTQLGLEFGNPGLRAGDPEAIRKLRASRDATYLNDILAQLDSWLPTVRRMRPEQPWGDVVRVLNRDTPLPWTVERLRRTVRRLEAEGIVEPRLLDRARRHAGDDRLLRLVANIAFAAPDYTLQQIASQLEVIRERTPRGGTRWHPSSVK